MNTRCAICGEPLTYTGKGQPPKTHPGECRTEYRSMVDAERTRTNGEHMRRERLLKEEREGYQFIARGFVFAERLPLSEPEEYFDFTTKQWSGAQLMADLSAGVLPWGLLVQAVGGAAGVVIPDPDGGQLVKPIWEVL